MENVTRAKVVRFCLLNDLCDAHVRALEYLESGIATDISNLGNGRGFSVTEVIDTAAAVAGVDIPDTVVGRRPGDLPALVAWSAKVKRVLGWTVIYTELPDIIATAWEWHSRERHKAVKEAERGTS